MKRILGDYDAFFERQVRRLEAGGIDVANFPVGHLAFRTVTLEAYLTAREQLEAVSSANVENRWNGRPISKLLLHQPLALGAKHVCSLVELIPPPHHRDCPMGLEHLGFVVGDDFEAFAARHRPALSGQQDQGPFNQPLFIRFEDSTAVKFHRHSLHDVVVMEGHRFDGMHHAKA